MAHDADEGSPRKGKLSAFALLKSWLFDKSNPGPPAHAETEFLNTRDGYELAKFAKENFGGEVEAKRAHEAAVDAEQAEIDYLLQSTGAVPIPLPPLAVAPVLVATTHAPAPAAVAAPAAGPKNTVEAAVKYLEQLRGQGLSVETLAEALIIIESRDVKKRASGGH